MKPRFLYLSLALCLLLSCFASASEPPFRSEKIPTAHGIDVSHHQGSIDWELLAPHIDFAIIRCGYGADLTSQDDRQWKANADACSRLGIPFGVYIFSYATTEAQALSEAQHVLRLVDGYQLSMPVYLDLEADSISQSCTPEQILRNATVFCEAIEKAGYEVGIYANTYWWTNYLSDPSYDRWDRWIARYASGPGYEGEYSMWQYSSEGVLPGITENTVDLDYWYGVPPTAEHQCSYTAKVLKEADCTRSGLLRYICHICGDFYEVIVSPYGHSWDAGTVTLEPTSGSEGIRLFTCLNCGQTRQESIPPLEDDPPSPAPCDGGANCPGRAFSDMPSPSHWAHEGIDFAVEYNLFHGMDESSFGPDIPMNRAMLVTVLWRYSGSPYKGSADFSDVPEGVWYTQPVAWAASEGIVSGVGNGCFDPEGRLTREQLAVILYRYCQYLNSDCSAKAALSHFEDEASVSPWAKEAVCWAVSEGLIGGTLKDGSLCLDPQGSATRAQVATILMRYLEAE